MGISELYKFLYDYINSVSYKSPIINRSVYYIDYTLYLIIAVNVYYKQKRNLNKSISQICDEIIDTLTDNLLAQLNKNRHQKYILVFDYRTISNINENFKFSDNILNDYIHKIIKTNKEQMDMIPMIPKNIDIHDIQLVKKSLRCMFEVRWSCWNQNADILNYENLYVYQKKHPEIDVSEFIKFGITRYLILRGIKNQKRIERKNNNCPIKNHKNSLNCKFESISTTLFDSNDFNTDFNKWLFTVNYSHILNLIPVFVSRVKKQFQHLDRVEFIGCENESDFVIKKHIIKYNLLNYPIIRTNDADMLMLLSDINCVVQIKLDSLISINPHDFWIWLSGLANPSYSQIVSFCCLLGTDYSDTIRHIHFNKNGKKTIHEFFQNMKINGESLIVELYLQWNLIENEFHEIQTNDDTIDVNLLKIKYNNVYTNYYGLNMLVQ